jgi:hypothetical protein
MEMKLWWAVTARGRGRRPEPDKQSSREKVRTLYIPGTVMVFADGDGKISDTVKLLEQDRSLDQFRGVRDLRRAMAFLTP